MWVFRGLWLALQWLEMGLVNFVPARTGRRYLRRRLRSNVPITKRWAMMTSLAELERKCGDLTASELAAREALRLVPDDWWPYVELASTFEAAGRLREAREALHTVLAMPRFDRRYEPYVRRELARLESPGSSSP